MKKKLVSVMMTIALAAGMLAGCGGSGTENAADGTQANGGAVSDGETTTTSVGTYSEENPYHLVFSFIEMYEQDENARAAVQDALNAYMVPEYHIEVEFLPVSFADYQTTTQLMLSGGDKLDVFPIMFTYAPSWINMEGIYDMSPLMDTEDGKKIVAALGEANAHVGTMNGVLYGFPANKESIELGGLCMRADICDELGLTEKYKLDAEDSDTYSGTSLRWEDAEEIFAAVKAAHPEMTPLYLSNSDQLSRFAFFDPLIDSFGGIDLEADRNSMKVINIFETETYKKVVTMLADWYDKGYIYQDAATDTQGTATMMKAGNTFSYATAIKPGFLSEAEAANGCDCYVLYLNSSDEGGIATHNVSFINTGISSNSDDPEMAFKFVSALYSDANVMNLWQYGIEGTNYQVLEDGTAYYVDGENDGNYAYHQNSGWAMGNQFISYVWNDGNKGSGYWEKLQKHNDWAFYSPAFGFMWDSTEYATQITALSNAYETYRAALHTGSVGSANVESTIQQLNDVLYAAGLQEVIDAKQKQLDAWTASNGR